MTTNSDSQSWHSTLIPASSNIQQAVFSLESSGLQIALVTSEEGKLIGTVTDGDIRRAFLKGYKLDSSIEKVIHRNALVVPPNIGRDLILQVMQANKIRQIPIVDTDGTILGLHVWDTMITPSALDNLMIIMAGGKGTRLRPHTEKCPKPMLEISGKPMLEHILQRAKSNGFHNFVISVNYLGEMIEEYFGNGNKFGVNIEYLREEHPLGTAGSLSIIKSRPTQPFVVTNGDVLSDIHYNEILDFHMRHNAAATMAVRQHEIQNQFGVVRTRGVEIEGFEEKPIYRSHINAGIYVLSPEVLSQLNYNQDCDMPTLFERVKQGSGRTIVYPMHEPWLDIGRPEDLTLANGG